MRRKRLLKWTLPGIYYNILNLLTMRLTEEEGYAGLLLKERSIK